MLVLNAGGRVTQLRFLPDGRLLIGLLRPTGVGAVECRRLDGGASLPLPFPGPDLWHRPNQIALSPNGDRLYLAAGPLHTVAAADGTSLPCGYTGPAGAVIAAADGGRVVVSHVTVAGETVLTGLTADGDPVWEQRFPHPEHQFLAGFADADRFLVVGGYAAPRVVTHSFAAGAPVGEVRHPTRSIDQPQLSPDGRRLGVIGHGSLYVYAAHTPGKAGQIKGGQTFGNFVGFAFHPAGKTLAVIHGGPTLLKLYDLATLTLRTKLNWKVGPLTCVAYSADGLLGAVGTDDGRVVVWDADE